jgi:hypothetical protein
MKGGWKTFLELHDQAYKDRRILVDLDEVVTVHEGRPTTAGAALYLSNGIVHHVHEDYESVREAMRRVLEQE